MAKFVAVGHAIFFDNFTYVGEAESHREAALSAAKKILDDQCKDSEKAVDALAWDNIIFIDAVIDRDFVIETNFEFRPDELIGVTTDFKPSSK